MPGPVRDTARTKRALLDAASRQLSVHGPAVTLEAVATAAGVSKGGLMHHYRTKDELFAALIDDLFDQFAASVVAQLDPDDDRPGRMLRAYIRATFGELADGQEAIEQTTLLAALSAMPDLASRAQGQYREWNARLMEDGISADRVRLVVRACDGVAIAPLYEGTLAEDEVKQTQAMLLALTEDPSSLLP